MSDHPTDDEVLERGHVQDAISTVRGTLPQNVLTAHLRREVPTTDERIAAKRPNTLDELEWRVLLDELGREVLDRSGTLGQISERTHDHINKYAALRTNWHFGTPQEISIDGNIRCSWWAVHEVGEDDARDAWQDAFGTFQWDALRSKCATVFVFAHDIADVTNSINKQLEARAQLARYAYLMNRPPILSGGAMWVISGMADNELRPVSLRSWNKYAELCNPYYVQRAPFQRSLGEFHANFWIRDWCSDFVAMDNARGGTWLICPPFEMAILSFWDASINSALDFRMPALVRTIESLVAPPRGSATFSFVQRSALFAHDIQGHPYFLATGRTLDAVLRELYQLRSEAVHGKWPLREMQRAGREDDVALLDFTAEMIARAVIRWALRNRLTFATYQTRSALEEAWANGSIPPP